MKKKVYIILFFSVLTLIILPSYIRAYEVTGNSDAPAYVFGDKIIVNLTAYGIKIPFTDNTIIHLKKPTAGDYVLIRNNEGTPIFKRVVAVPGNTIEMIDNRLIINGKYLRYEKIDLQKVNELRLQSQLGSVIEKEIGNGDDNIISYKKETNTLSTFPPEKIPEDMYFVLGSNRDNSTDSRHFGYVSRNRIMGKVIYKF